MTNEGNAAESVSVYSFDMIIVKEYESENRNFNLYRCNAK